jgi:TetR/AcrR family transcriptional regulator
MSSYLSAAFILDHAYLTSLAKQDIITRTFLRLDPSRREAVVTSILEEAALKGPTQINIKEVARRAGVSIGSLYQYFNRRQGLLDFAIEIITRQMTFLFDSIRPYLKDMSLVESIRAYLQGGYEMEQEFRGYIRFFTKAAYQDDPEVTEKIVKPVAEVMLSITREMIEIARSRGEIRPDVDLETAARLINTMIIAVYDAQFIPTLNTYYQLTGNNVSAERIRDSLLSFIENALKVNNR